MEQLEWSMLPKTEGGKQMRKINLIFSFVIILFTAGVYAEPRAVNPENGPLVNTTPVETSTNYCGFSVLNRNISKAVLNDVANVMAMLESLAAEDTTTKTYSCITSHHLVIVWLTGEDSAPEIFATVFQ